ncbi:MAG: tRNA (N6-threonylcarbamoyladenosine(37)-N6)-methyltransferase TrmO [Candidatus Brocadiae bacterium]|nr:tRNA (N6-threonylcarbamoyladenosine(37)-N6)-methyltransferase TrmO [Candidatus Brocadiia bacterium]
MEDEFRVTPIGVVHRDETAASDAECMIEIRPELQLAMLGIEAGRRLQVLYWMHRLGDDDRRILQCHPRGDRSRPKRGVFALRSPMRPNPIGSTVVEVKAVRGNELLVTGLDALDGSPVVDLKIAT